MARCQSCGMPMSKDPQGGGTDSDGGKSKMYCSFCYKDGAFVGGDMTVEQFQEHCRQIMIKQGTPRFFAWLLTRGMKRLGRWKKA